jgi:uncharacterized membrane protein YcaP (DUF421 family)
VIYIAALVTVRLVGDRRFIGKYAALDVLLTVILGSTLSRASWCPEITMGLR